jgi:hypothetical protein
MGVHLKLLHLPAEQALTATIRSISERRSIKSPALDSGLPTDTRPVAEIATFMNMLKAVGI